ncbi:MAG: hypothetical protein KDB11_34790, partial [Planctomycetales bacterium]|nr:hypothetical protein [Planctomycetales bacterium]
EKARSNLGATFSITNESCEPPPIESEPIATHKPRSNINRQRRRPNKSQLRCNQYLDQAR